VAQKTVLELVDDIDGGPADETVAFALDGVEFVIDLSAENAARLRDTLAEYVGHARRIGGRKSRTRTTAAVPEPVAAAPEPVAAANGKPDTKPDTQPDTKPDAKPDTQAVREWARSQGETVAERGRVPQAVVMKFQEAHA
jgi:hypothetical protein